jgi:hypothetical protein
LAKAVDRRMRGEPRRAEIRKKIGTELTGINRTFG